MSRPDLLRAAVRRFRFRRARPDEPPEAYRAAVIDFVMSRDFGAAHELRLDKPQAEWTPEDAQGFVEHLRGMPHPRLGPLPPGSAIPVLRTPGPFAVTDDTLRELARCALEGGVDTRTKDPTLEMQILASVLLMDGSVLTTITRRGNRVEILKTLAQQAPTYGFLIAFDAYVHAVALDPAGKALRAEKLDCLLVHYATRTMRETLKQVYRVIDGAAIFDPEVETVAGDKFTEDPYAEVFVSVPLAGGQPS
jgi:hypothetical protein